MNLNATILGQAIALVLFVLFCVKYVWSPLMVTTEKRQKEITDGFASVERAHKDLDLVKVSVTDQLKKAKVEAQVIIEQANKCRSQTLGEVKAEAGQERTKIVAQAQAKTEVGRKRVREELRKQVAILAAAGAEKIIERSVDEAANGDIVDKLATELQGGRG